MQKKVSFFHRKEYRNFLKCHDAVEKNPSNKNLSLYLTWYTSSYTLAMKEYNDIGWNESKGEYDWRKELDMVGEKDVIR
jgi:hypothetical protein